MSVRALIEGRRLVVCVGPGGVGKTTAAAALALRAAATGAKVAVLTIDPARRLAGALGLTGLDDRLTPVDVPGPGELHAAMIDTKSSYDALIARIAEGEDARARILSNRVYRAFSRTLARSHAYVAMERLHDVIVPGRFDLVVLDTPPARSALEILDAPGRLSRFLQGRVLRFFLREQSSLATAVMATPVLRLLEAAAGKPVVEELLSFFGALAALRSGFEARARRTTEILAEPSTAFLLVVEPRDGCLADAALLRDGLLERRVHIDAVLFNRAYVPEPGDLRRPVSPESRLDPRSLPEPLRDAGRALLDLRRAIALENARARERMDRFAAALPSSARRLVAPRLDLDIRDRASLEDLFPDLV